MTSTMLHTLEILAGGLVNGLWISVLLIAVTAGLLRLIGARRPVNASTRYGVWFVALLAVVAAHVIGSGLAGLQLPGARTTDGPDAGHVAAQAMLSDAAVAGNSEAGRSTEPPRAASLEEAPSPPLAGHQTPAPDRFAQQEIPSGAGFVTHDPFAEQATAASPSGASGAFSIDLKGGLFLLAALALLVWFARMVAGLASIVSSWRHVRTLKSGARRIDFSEWNGLLPTTCHRRFEVAESPDVTSPVAAGLRSPMILIPLGLRERLTTDEFRQVLLHEVAHLERFDDWTILAQRIGEAVLWHHPAMWKVSNELQESREMACDDWVVSRTRRPEAYVHSIGRMIELNLGTRSLQLAPGLAAERGDLLSRMRRLLNDKLPESSRLSGEQIAVAGGLVGLVLVLVAVFVPLMQMAFSFGDGEAIPYVFGEDHDQSVQRQETPAASTHLIEELPPLAPLPPLPALPPLPELRPVPAVAELPPLPPRASSAMQREQPPPPPVSANAPPAPTAPRSSSAELSVRSWLRIFDSASKVSSNGERADVLHTALTAMPDDDRVVRGWLRTVDGMSSSGSKAELLVDFVGSTRLDSDRINWIRNAAGSIRSRGDRERVMRALSDKL